MKWKSIKDLSLDIAQWSSSISRRQYGYVVGIPDSGLTVACMFSAYARKRIRTDVIGGKPLVLDDTVLKGTTMKKWKKKYPHALFGAVYVKPGMEEVCDYFYETLETPRIFQWNLFKHAKLPQMCMDIDGVLCRDPSRLEIRHKDRYLDFIANTEPKIRVERPVGWIVTCRHEKYREQTAKWLDKAGIKYKHLVMRKPDEPHVAFKSRIYGGCKAVLFIESSHRQAQGIAKRTGKPVLCTDTMKLVSL